MVKRLRLHKKSESRTLGISVNREFDNFLASEFSLTFQGGQGVICLKDQKLSDLVTLKSMEMAIPKIAFPFDMSKGVKGLRNKRLKLTKLKIALNLDTLAEFANNNISNQGWLNNLRIMFHNEYISAICNMGPVESDFQVSLRLLPLKNSPDISFLIDNIRAYGGIPTPLINSAAIIIKEITRKDPDGLKITFKDPVKQILFKVMPSKGWRIPEYDSVELADVTLLPDRCILTFLAQSERGTEIEEYSPQGEERNLFIEKKLKEYEFLKEADSLLAKGDTAGARKIYASILENNSDSPLLATRLAMIDILTPSLRQTVLDYLLDLIADNDQRTDTLAVIAQNAAFLKDKEQEAWALEELFKNSSPLEMHGAAVRMAGLLKNIDPKKATSHLETALAARKNDPETMASLLEFYSFTKNKTGLLEMIPEWIAIHKESAGRINAYQKAAEELLNGDEFEEAISYFEKVLMLQPDNEDAGWGLAASLAGAQLTQKAIDKYNTLANIARQNNNMENLAMALGAIGEIHIDNNNPELGIPHLKAALKTHWRSDIQILLADALRQSGKTGEAIAHYEEALESEAIKNSDEWSNHALTLAKLYFEHNDNYASALKWTKAAQKNNALFAQCQSLHIQILEKQKKWEELAKTLESKLLRTGNGNDVSIETILSLSKARIAAGQYSAAISTLESTIDKYPDRTDLLEMYMEASVAAKDNLRLLNIIKSRHRTVNDKDKRAKMALTAGTLLLNEFEDPHSAKTWLLKALDDNENLFEARENLIIAKTRTGDTENMDKALGELITRYLEKGKKTEAADAMHQLAEILIKKGETKKGAGILRTALPDLPKEVRQSALLKLADIYFKAEEFTVSKDMYGRARQGDNKRENYIAALGEAEAAFKCQDFQCAYEAAIAAGSGPADLRCQSVKLLAKASVHVNKAGDALKVVERVAQNVSKKEAVELYDLAADIAWKELGDFDSAKSYYDEILNIEPSSDYARNRMISLLEEKGDRVILARTLVRFADFSQNPAVEYQRAADFFSAENLNDEAADALWKAYQANPDVESAKMLASILKRTGDDEKMVSVLNSFAKSDETVRLMLIDYFKENGQEEKLLTLLRMAKGTTAAKEKERLMELAALEFKKGEKIAGAGHLLNAGELDIDDEDKKEIFKQIFKIAENEKHPSLLSRLKESFKDLLSDQESVNLELTLAVMYFEDGATDKGEASVDRALKYRPINFDLFFKFSNKRTNFEYLVKATSELAFQEGRWEEHGALLGNLLEVASRESRPELLRKRVTVYEQRLNKKSEAINDLLELKQIDKLSVTELFKLEKLLHDQNRFEEELDVAVQRAESMDFDYNTSIEVAQLARKLKNNEIERELLSKIVLKTPSAKMLFRILQLTDEYKNREELDLIILQLEKDLESLDGDEKKQLLLLKLRLIDENTKEEDIIETLFQLSMIDPEGGYFNELKTMLEAKDQWGFLASKIDQRLTLDISDEEKTELLITIGRIYRDKLADLPRAKDSFKGALKITPDNIPASMALGEIAFKSSDWIMLEQYLEILKSAPWHPDAAYWRGKMEEERGNIDLALAEYRILTDRAPQHTEAMLGFLRTVPKGEEIDTVILACESACSEKNSEISAAMHEKAATAYFTIKNMPLALKHFEAALSLNSDNLEILSNLAEIYRLLHKYDEAALVLTKMAQMTEGNSSIDFMVAAARLYYDKTKEYHKAFELFIKALEISPKEPDVLLGAADCAWQLKDYNMVATNLERVRIVAPHLTLDAVRLYQFAFSLNATMQWPKEDIAELLERTIPNLKGEVLDLAQSLLNQLKQR
ncbi:MAG: tetratricopeptide repeat protein [Deltaproteobacteria bacterium]|nr:tetratricopeptide repeat protein [Deltaproteobacteria bacterium]